MRHQASVDERVNGQSGRLLADLERQVIASTQVHAHGGVGAGADQQRTPSEHGGHRGVYVAARDHLRMLGQQLLERRAVLACERDRVHRAYAGEHGRVVKRQQRGRSGALGKRDIQSGELVGSQHTAVVPRLPAVAANHAQRPTAKFTGVPAGAEAGAKRARSRSRSSWLPGITCSRQLQRCGQLVGAWRGSVREIATQQHRHRARLEFLHPAHCALQASCRAAPVLAVAQMQIAELDQRGLGVRGRHRAE